MEELQTSEDTRCGWINYSAFDAKSTHQLYDCLSAQLSDTACSLDPAIQEALDVGTFTMLDFYESYWRPFGELLTDMEKYGMLVNRSVRWIFYLMVVFHLSRFATLDSLLLCHGK